MKKFQATTCKRLEVLLALNRLLSPPERRELAALLRANHRAAEAAVSEEEPWFGENGSVIALRTRLDGIRATCRVEGDTHRLGSATRDAFLRVHALLLKGEIVSALQLCPTGRTLDRLAELSGTPRNQPLRRV